MASSPYQDTSHVDKDAEGGRGEKEIPDKRRGKRKEPEVPETQRTSGATSNHNVKNAVPVTRSPVWAHFERLKGDRDKCNCVYCGKEFKCASRSGTSTLGQHLRICKQYKAWSDGQSKKQTVIADGGGLNPAKVSESVFREASNEMLVLGQLPLSFIESVAWKHFCKKVKLYKPKCRKTATKDIMKMYIRRKDELKNWIITNKQRVSLTTDIWVSQVTAASYMVITLHVIDSNWDLKKLIIGFKHVSDHKGQTISSVLLDCLAEWGIEKVFCITVDNATANTLALKKFHTEFSKLSSEAFVLDGKYFHMRCCAHIINLIAKEGLYDLGVSVASIRNGIQYVRSSSNRLEAFQSKVEKGKMSRGSLPLDVTTRWNSIFLMLTRAMQFRVAFDKMQAEDKLYHDYFMEVDKATWTKRIGPPDRFDWDEVNMLCGFLVMFYDSTLVVSASTKVNSCKSYCQIVILESNLKKKAYQSESDLELKVKASEMLEKFQKYWGGMKNINKMLIIASIFDPRQKMNFAKLCFERLYGAKSEEAVAMHDDMYAFLELMFKEYNARAAKASSTAPTTPTQTQSQSTQTSSLSGEDHGVDKMELDYEKFTYEKMDCVYKELVAETGVADVRDELEIYLKEPIENPKLMKGTEYDVLSYWKRNQGKFPVLSEMAKDLLAMQVSSVASESAFSTSGRILEPHRSCLSHFMIEVLMCTEQWMKADIHLSEKTVVINEQMLAAIEELDEIEKKYQNASTQDLQDDDDD